MYWSAGVAWAPKKREEEGVAPGLMERAVWYFLRRGCTADLSGLQIFLSVQDMNREVVKTDSATTRIPELEFEIPAFSQKGGKFKISVFGLFMPSWNLTHFLVKSLGPGLVPLYGFGHVITVIFIILI